MDRIRRTDLQELLEPRKGPCVSLFMPMHLTGRDGMEDPVRLRKLADDAEEALVAGGLRRPQARELVAPLRELPNDPVAWQHRGRVFAFFAAPGFQRVIHATGEIEPAVHVSDQFCI